MNSKKYKFCVPFCYFEKKKDCAMLLLFFFSFNIMAYSICWLVKTSVVWRQRTNGPDNAFCSAASVQLYILYTKNIRLSSSFLFFSQKELLSLDKNRAMSLQPDSKNKASRSASAPPGTSGAGSEKLKDKCRLMWIRQKQLQTILHTHTHTYI